MSARVQSIFFCFSVAPSLPLSWQRPNVNRLASTSFHCMTSSTATRPEKRVLLLIARLIDRSINRAFDFPLALFALYLSRSIPISQSLIFRSSPVDPLFSFVISRLLIFLLSFPPNSFNPLSISSKNCNLFLITLTSSLALRA